MNSKRTVFFISDGTGITVETFGRSLLAQFENIEFEEITIPYVNAPAKAFEVIHQIEAVFQMEQNKPLVFSSLLNPDIRNLFSSCNAMVFDLFKTFLDPLQSELQSPCSLTIGKTRSIEHNQHYNMRIEAVNFALSNDDGANINHYAEADVILLGVSRSGKTPTCLYLALQFGIFAANYPLTEDDFSRAGLPDFLMPVKAKLFGLTIEAERLHAIRQERQPNSRYASLAQCEKETLWVESFFKKEKIPSLYTTTRSIEEIATTILNMKGIQRRLRVKN